MNDLAQDIGLAAHLECATMKATIVRELGQSDILLPSLVTEGLAGDWVTVDANEGCLYLGRGDIITRRPEAELAEVSGWQQPHSLAQDATS